MKVLIWVLNILQFFIAYFISYALYFFGILELLPPETGVVGKSVWPAAAIGMALIPWKYYNRFSYYIIAQTTNTKVPEINVSNKTTPKPSKLLYTFFFGYAAFKWRRLIRTILVLQFLFLVFSPLDRLVDLEERSNNYIELIIKEEGAERVVEQYGSIAIAKEKTYLRWLYGLLEEAGIFIIIQVAVIGLISWIIKPFVVKQEKS